MLKHIGKWAMLSSPSMFPILPKAGNSLKTDHLTVISTIKAFKTSNQRALHICCGARRRLRYEDEDDESGEEEHGYNEEIAMLELYSQSARGEALIVHALVDDEQEVEVLIFKGFSSCLSYGTSPDPSRSVIPARAVIKSIDRIKGPFDPSNIEYIEKGLKWDYFKTRLAST
ncbi:hypothetical protein CRYUN_Cryun04dG0175700 [Craigia yunnanensis]